MQTKQPTYFIEQVVFDNGISAKSLPPLPVKELNNQLRISAKFNVNTIAIFKIYLK